MLTQQKLKSILHYDPDTGIFTNIAHRANRCKIGDKVGSKSKLGYLSTQIKGKAYLLHQLAWFYMYGYFPKIIDHINGITCDNRILNLRECNQSQNCGNTKKSKSNTSGYKGVSWSKSHNSWISRLMINGKSIYLGKYKNIEDAKEVYKIASIKHFGEFARQE